MIDSFDKRYSQWDLRTSDNKKLSMPMRKYIFICEGANTEVWYFQGLIDRRRELGIDPNLDIMVMERKEDAKDLSNPKHLLNFAENVKANTDVGFDRKYDRVVIIFDADIFNGKSEDYVDLIQEGEKYSENILGVTNPGFELFLILHYENSYEEEIKPCTAKLLSKKETGKKHYACTIFSKISGMNSKKSENIANLVSKVSVAIEQEGKHLNTNIHTCIGQLTSNIGQIIASIMSEKLPC